MSIFSLIALAILTAILAWYRATKPLAIDPVLGQVARYGIVIVGWILLGGGLLNILASFLLTNAIYQVVFNKYSGNDLWFFDDDTWLGKQVVKYLGEGSGQVWFFIQLIAAILIVLI